MVREANMRHATSEKLLRESKLQVDVLSAEVSALKTLVLTSTPSRPNPHLHPQIESKNSSGKEDGQNSSSSGKILIGSVLLLVSRFQGWEILNIFMSIHVTLL